MVHLNTLDAVRVPVGFKILPRSGGLQTAVGAIWKSPFLDVSHFFFPVSGFHKPPPPKWLRRLDPTSIAFLYLLNGPSRMFSNQRLWINGRSSERGQVITSTNISKGDADISQKPPALDSFDG